MQKPVKYGLLSAVISLSFAYGVAVGVYHWPPYSLLIQLNNSSPPVFADDPEQQLLSYAFTEPLVPGDQVLDSVSSLEDLHRRVDAMVLPTELYWNAARSMTIDSVNNLQLSMSPSKQFSLLRVQYSIGGRSYDAYAYRNPLSANQAKDAAVIVIPGSGLNQSHAIQTRDPENYQFGILDAFGDEADAYVFIKPNQDCLAIHNNEKKLNRDFYSNWLLSKGAAYSAHYLAGSIAVTKALQQDYGRVVVCGLSQGGEAALLNALQTEPTVAIVASGYSALYDKIKWAGYNQIAIPGFLDKLSIPQMRDTIALQSTQYLFTWGEKEQGTYGIEARQGLLRKAFSDLDNVTCEVHAGGHRYPLSLVNEFCISRQRR